jgi:hypothetical protein
METLETRKVMKDLLDAFSELKPKTTTVATFAFKRMTDKDFAL